MKANRETEGAKSMPQPVYWLEWLAEPLPADRLLGRWVDSRSVVFPSVRTAWRASFTRRAPRGTSATPVFRRMPTALWRRGTSITPIPVTTIVIVFLASLAPTVTVTIPTWITVVSATVVVTSAWSTMSHVFSWSRRVGALSYWVVDTNATTVQFLKRNYFMQ